MMVHSFWMTHTPFYTSLTRLLVLLQPAVEHASPTQFFPLNKLLFLPSLQKDILLPAHILVAHLSWILLLHQNPQVENHQVENPQVNLVQLKNWLERHFFKFDFYFMLAIWANHTKIQCASTETCDTCANVHMFFFGARCFRKFADNKNEICGLCRATHTNSIPQSDTQ